MTPTNERASLARCIVFLLLQRFSSGFPFEASRRDADDLRAEMENMVDITGAKHPSLPTHLTTIKNPLAAEETIGDPLNPDDFNHASRKSELNVTLNANDPTLMAGLFQGDIQLTTRDISLLSTPVSYSKTKNATLRLRNAVIDPKKTWPNAEIPYSISASYNARERATIANAMAAYHQNTCIKFVPKTTESDYIFITKGFGCSSAVGRTGGMQIVTLGDGCIYFGIVIHELMHASGFWHEQSRADRDDYITVVYSNIQNGQKYNFEKYSWNMIQSLGVPYDLGSVMHYGNRSFAKDISKPTIIVKNGLSIGQRDNFSKVDILKLNKLYECRSTNATTSSPPPSVCQDNHENCQYWASMNECINNPLWMLSNCQLSCNQCDSICENKNGNCDAWAQQGECNANPQYMNKFCVKACNTC